MRTGNPMLTAEAFQPSKLFQIEDRASSTMTLSGTVLKTALLLAVVMASAGLSWWQVSLGAMQPGVLIAAGSIGGFILALITTFRPTAAPYTSPFYAAAEGLFLGALSILFETRYPGIAFQAVALTFGTLAALLLAYSSGLIKPSENFKLGVAAATGGLCLLYLVSFVLSFFHISIPFIHQSGTIGIAFSGFVVILAAMNLVLDFDFIESGCDSGAPKYMEWYAAFGLLVTLVWLYVEILRLLSKLRSRD